MQITECELAHILITENSADQLIILREKDGQRILLIYIGIYEAGVINRYVSGEASFRPMTHDLLLKIMDQLKGSLERFIVNDLNDGTYYGTLCLRKENDELIEVDCRPSDGVALALNRKSTIYVADHLLEQPQP